jgi:hypothetical protein
MQATSDATAVAVHTQWKEMCIASFHDEATRIASCHTIMAAHSEVTSAAQAGQWKQ